MKNKKLDLVILSLLACCLAFATAAGAAVISDEELTSISDTAFIVTWSTTDEASTTEIEYGLGALTETATAAGTTKYHYAVVSGLFPAQTYTYRVKSNSSVGPTHTVQTLARPTGDYLFSFAVLNDPRYAEGKADDPPGARGIPYSICSPVLSSEVNDIKAQDPAFIVINGNIVDNWDDDTRGDQAKNQFLSHFASFSGSADLGLPAYRLNPTAGFYDKSITTHYTKNWIADNLNPIYGAGRSETYTGADAGTDSVFNYHFKYKFYNFVFLDSVLAKSAGGRVDLAKVRDLITAESSKSFVFMNFPAYDFSGVTVDGVLLHDYPLDLPSLESGVVCVDNGDALRATLEALTYSIGGISYPLTAAVVSGLISDNYLRDIHGISYVRQGPAVQFPTGYSIYKVYTNGYQKTFYKTTGRDAGDKPYYEYARDLIADTSGIPKQFLTAFWLGSTSMRNFTYTYAFVPGPGPQVRQTAPAAADSAVPLNKPILITFNKRMSTANLLNWVTVSPSVATTAASLDATRTILTVRHTDFSPGQTYTVTVSGSLASDEGSVRMGTDYSFSFNTNGGVRDTAAPAVSITPLPFNSTTNILPTLMGAATDESIVVGVEFRVDGGPWLAASPVDGAFNSTVEAFVINIASPLARGAHLIEIRASDGAGNTTISGFTAYSFSVIEDRPVISLLIDGVKPLPGDPISAAPRISVTVSTTNAPATGRLTFAGTTAPLSFTAVDNNYYATYEVGASLPDGTYGLTVEAFDSANKAATFEVVPLFIQSTQGLTVQGTPLSYPNPYDPGLGPVLISYTLSKAAGITLQIHDLSGTLVSRMNFAASGQGGRAGYNAVSWNGRSDSGALFGNGLYIYLIIADGKVVARGKLTVLKR